VSYIIPDGYIGSIHIIYSTEQVKSKNQPKQYNRLYQIPPNGVLFIKTSPNTTSPWPNENNVTFYHHIKGELVEITERRARAEKNTPDNRKDTQIKIYGSSTGKYESKYADCIILSQSYYTGSTANIHDQVNMFDLTDYIKKEPIDCTGMQPGTIRKKWLQSQSKN